MNKLEIFVGGNPYSNDDINFMQASAEQAYAGILRTLMPTSSNFVMSGCVPTYFVTTCTAVSEGFLYIGGELVYSPAQTGLAIDTDLGYLAARVKNTNTTPVIYKNGESKVVQQVRVVEWVQGTSQSPAAENISWWRFTFLRNYREVYPITFTSPWASSATQPFRVSRIGDVVVLEGKAFYNLLGSPTGMVKIGTIGNGLAPKRQIETTAFELTDAEIPSAFAQFKRIVIKTNGDIEVGSGVNGNPAGSIGIQLAAPITWNLV